MSVQRGAREEFDPVFEWLVRYHVERNLLLFTRGMVNGRSPLVQESDIGFDDAVPQGCKRMLIIANGDTLVDRLRESGTVLDMERPIFAAVRDYDLFAEYFDGSRGDGAYVLNKRDSQLGRVHELANDVPLPEGFATLMSQVPLVLLSLNESVALTELGCKTRLAVKLPFRKFADGEQPHSIDTYQIKATVHSLVGPGPVTHFNREGCEVFHFQYDLAHQGEFINPEQRIVGVYRKYRHEEGQLFRPLPPEIVCLKEGRLCYANPFC